MFSQSHCSMGRLMKVLFKISHRLEPSKTSAPKSDRHTEHINLKRHLKIQTVGGYCTKKLLFNMWNENDIWKISHEWGGRTVRAWFSILRSPSTPFTTMVLWLQQQRQYKSPLVQGQNKRRPMAKIFKVGILKYFNSPTLRNRRRFWKTLSLKSKKTLRSQMPNMPRDGPLSGMKREMYGWERVGYTDAQSEIGRASCRERV